MPVISNQYFHNAIIQGHDAGIMVALQVKDFLLLLYALIHTSMSERTEKVNKLLQRELAEIFQIACRDFYKGVMITVTTVRVSPDLSVAKIYLSIFPGTNTENILEDISNNKKYFRHQLGQRIRNQVKTIPDLSFFLDDSLDYIDNIDDLLK
jgi:ribosome-binding factor A